jgi:hypothetical protein
MNESSGKSGQSVDKLVRLLKDSDPQVRGEARRQLCERGREAIPELVNALRSASEDVRFEISKALTGMGETVVDPMLEAILHPDIHVRAVAARVLSLVGGEDALRRLEEATNNEKRKTVRKELREASAMITRKLESLELAHSATAGEGGGEPGSEAELKPKDQEEKKLYLNIVRNLVLSNWARPLLFPEGSERPQVLVTLKADRDGSVSRVLIENKWQNTALGASLKEAIRRSSPLPPVPEIIAPGKTEIDLTFILTAPY